MQVCVDLCRTDDKSNLISLAAIALASVQARLEVLEHWASEGNYDTGSRQSWRDLLLGVTIVIATTAMLIPSHVRERWYSNRSI